MSVSLHVLKRTSSSCNSVGKEIEEGAITQIQFEIDPPIQGGRGAQVCSFV